MELENAVEALDGAGKRMSRNVARCWANMCRLDRAWMIRLDWYLTDVLTRLPAEVYPVSLTTGAAGVQRTMDASRRHNDKTPVGAVELLVLDANNKVGLGEKDQLKVVDHAFRFYPAGRGRERPHQARRRRYLRKPVHTETCIKKV